MSSRFSNLVSPGLGADNTKFHADITFIYWTTITNINSIFLTHGVQFMMLFLVTKHCAVCQLIPTYRLTIKRCDHKRAGSRSYHTSHKRDIKDSRFSVPTLTLQIVTNNNTQSVGLHTRPIKHVRTCGQLKKCMNSIIYCIFRCFQLMPNVSQKIFNDSQGKNWLSAKRSAWCAFWRANHMPGILTNQSLSRKWGMSVYFVISWLIAQYA